MIVEPPGRIRTTRNGPTGHMRVVSCGSSAATVPAPTTTAQRAHACGAMQNVFLARDALGFARVGGDEAVEALAEMADRDRRSRIALQMGRYRSIRAWRGSSAGSTTSQPTSGRHAMTAPESSSSAGCNRASSSSVRSRLICAARRPPPREPPPARCSTHRR